MDKLHPLVQLYAFGITYHDYDIWGNQRVPSILVWFIQFPIWTIEDVIRGFLNALAVDMAGYDEEWNNRSDGDKIIPLILTMMVSVVMLQLSGLAMLLVMILAMLYLANGHEKMIELWEEFYPKAVQWVEDFWVGTYDAFEEYQAHDITDDPNLARAKANQRDYAAFNLYVPDTTWILR